MKEIKFKISELNKKMLHPGFIEHISYDTDNTSVIFLGSEEQNNPADYDMELNDYYLVNHDDIYMVCRPNFEYTLAGSSLEFDFTYLDIVAIEENIDNIYFAIWIPALYKAKKLLVLK